ncbi:hypothetical protein Pmani_008314 [Petrolisthes manimaculis]|uniref:MADF domain-containing protein n=1 Tax=Petrolisthes manimaculis TaxID=1843537 RepID=A0AAE1Q5T6_9EUCA|nr:hypothetical protein Pmani_008314 [Petrolisthes manimaculis]
MAEKKKESERKMMMEIIDVYRSLSALWKIKSDEYSDREKKADAYKILYGKYKEHYPNATLEEMKKKINTLRTNFRAELRKVERSEKSGAGTEDIHVPRLWYFDAMLFLRDQETPAPSTSSIMVPEESHEGQKENDTEQDERSVGLDQGVTTTNAVPTESCCERPNEEKSASSLTADESVPLTGKGAATKRRREEAKKNELITLATNSLLKESLEDEHDIQGKAWANQLRKMDPMQQLFAKKAIDDVLFEGRCGNLSRNSCTINQTNSSTPHSLPSYADTLSRTSTPNSMHSTHSYPSHMDTSRGFQSNVQDANETNFVEANPLVSKTIRLIVCGEVLVRNFISSKEFPVAKKRNVILRRAFGEMASRMVVFCLTIIGITKLRSSS